MEKPKVIIGRVKQLVAEITGDENLYNEGLSQSADTDGPTLAPTPCVSRSVKGETGVSPSDCSWLLTRSQEISREAHSSQFDKTGRPYFEHCQRVAAKVRTTQEKTVAFLHDVVEKNPGWTIARLRLEGFSEDIVEALDSLTRRSDEDEEKFLNRSTASKLSRTVKVADLEDNITQANIAHMDDSKYVRHLAIVQKKAAEPG